MREWVDELMGRCVDGG